MKICIHEKMKNDILFFVGERRVVSFSEFEKSDVSYFFSEKGRAS